MLDRLPPQNVEMESSLLAACLCDPSVVTEIVDIVRPADFFKEKNKTIFSAVRDLHRRKEPIELPTIHDEIRKHTDESGFGTYLAELVDSVPRATDAAHYAVEIKQKAAQRALISIASRTIADCLKGECGAPELIERLEKELHAIDTGRKTIGHSLRDTALDAIERLESLKAGSISGVSTGFTTIDKFTGGLQSSDLIILAARPAMGKTAFALNILDNITAAGIPATIFSLEMSRIQLVNRLLSKMARINGSRFRGDTFTPDEWQRITDAGNVLSQRPLCVCDNSDLSISDIRREARRMKRQHDIQLLVVDYLQLLRGDNTQNRVAEVSSISRGLKLMAKELDIPVMALSQLNRTVETRNNKRPTLADLRDSGSIEQDADIVAFLYRDEVYNQDENNPNRGTAELIFAKHRNGDLGTIQLYFQKALTAFFEASK